MLWRKKSPLNSTSNLGNGVGGKPMSERMLDAVSRMSSEVQNMPSAAVDQQQCKQFEAVYTDNWHMHPLE